MDFAALFSAQLDALRKDGDYRIFADPERRRGGFPKALNRYGGGERDVAVRRSTDYLGMGQHADVVGAMREPDQYGGVRHAIILEAADTCEGAHGVHALIFGRAQTGIQAIMQTAAAPRRRAPPRRRAGAR